MKSFAVRRRPLLVVGYCIGDKSSDEIGEGLPASSTKRRRSVKSGKAEHLGHCREPVLIRINEEHTIPTVVDGKDGEDEGLRNHLGQVAYPRFQGSHPRYTEQQGVAA